jgi:hemerythrin-like domain-containing protein
MSRHLRTPTSEVARYFFSSDRDPDQEIHGVYAGRGWRPDVGCSCGQDQFGSEATISDPIALWHTEHVNFARLLDLLEGELDLFQRAQAPDYELMLDIMFYMTHYPDVLHHPKEDLAFARIANREASAAPIVDRLAGQHARLKEDGNALVVALDDIVNGSITLREHVDAPGRAYIAAFRSHMDSEETAILPLAAKLLHDEDWAEIAAAMLCIDDPLFGKGAEPRYAALRRHIARQARASKG